MAHRTGPTVVGTGAGATPTACTSYAGFEAASRRGRATSRTGTGVNRPHPGDSLPYSPSHARGPRSRRVAGQCPGTWPKRERAACPPREAENRSRRRSGGNLSHRARRREPVTGAAVIEPGPWTESRNAFYSGPGGQDAFYGYPGTGTAPRGEPGAARHVGDREPGARRQLAGHGTCRDEPRTNRGAHPRSLNRRAWAISQSRSEILSRGLLPERPRPHRRRKFVP